MKPINYTIAFVVILFFGAYSNSIANGDAETTTQLPRMAEVLKEHHVGIDHWSVYARQNLKSVSNSSTFKQQLQTLKKKLPDFEWDDVKVNQAGQYEVEGHSKVSDHVSEQVQLFMYPQKNHKASYVIYELEGQTWNGNTWQTFSPTVDSRISTIFKETTDTKLYTTISGQKQAVSSKLLPAAQSYAKGLHARVVEKVKEKTFVSLSAYNTAWNQLIRTNGQKMNLQVALRTVGSTTTVTLGTPIITSEY
ncbi:YwmB family TATA-box binding protein [Tuberibacillus sp. Marseille-P3662]|uniref:YwmB family TATA-box binding protein n=1 Tax=Tuberibacillus sp. Marseille-P3662 TaxID=1965358 RepID=UPI000A1CA815|nr:YwmB family TATA-box binding protein [Tuberibacillus sp. Marseille-P3662]